MRAGAALRALLLAAAVLGTVASAAAQDEAPETVVDLQTRPGATLRLLLLRPADPQGSVILFAGGHGVLALRPDGTIGWGAGNFLVRSRRFFARAGLVTAVVDAASDLQGGGAGKAGYRVSAEHAEDVRAVIAHLRAIRGPVVLVGTSRGTISAASAGARLREGGPDGIVLSSSVTQGRGSLQELSLGRIKAPVLLVHHREDPCRATPFGDVGWLRGALSGSSGVDVHPVTGGGPQRGDPCEAHSHHGFVGIEREVVDVIADWVKTRGPGRGAG
jgi:hypothetical protein